TVLVMYHDYEPRLSKVLRIEIERSLFASNDVLYVHWSERLDPRREDVLPEPRSINRYLGYEQGGDRLREIVLPACQAHLVPQGSREIQDLLRKRVRDALHIGPLDC